MHRIIPVLAPLVLPLILTGCGYALPGHIGGLVTYVSPEDYGERLCAHVDLELYPACLSQVLDHFGDSRTRAPARYQSGLLPLAVAMDDRLYLGTFDWGPFNSSFSVTSGTKTCRGSYAAFGGSQDALYDVYCNDGRAGWAATIRDQSGHNGIGQLTLTDGTKGEIVFGHRPLGLAEPINEAKAPQNATQQVPQQAAR
jgi:hypothetical protein